MVLLELCRVGEIEKRQHESSSAINGMSASLVNVQPLVSEARVSFRPMYFCSCVLVHVLQGSSRIAAAICRRCVAAMTHAHQWW